MRRQRKLDAMRLAITMSERTKTATSVSGRNMIGRAIALTVSAIWPSVMRSRRRAIRAD